MQIQEIIIYSLQLVEINKRTVTAPVPKFWITCKHTIFYQVANFLYQRKLISVSGSYLP